MRSPLVGGKVKPVSKHRPCDFFLGQCPSYQHPAGIYSAPASEDRTWGGGGVFTASFVCVWPVPVRDSVFPWR